MVIAWVYLFLSVWLAAVVLKLLFPRLYWHIFDAGAAFAAMVLSMFMPQFFASGLLTTVVVWSLGGLEHRAGQLGLGLHLVSWMAMSGLVLAMRKRHPILDGAPVRDSDQPFAETLEESELRALLPARLQWLQMVSLRVARLDRIRIERSIPYRTVDGRTLKLDVYRPSEPGEQGRRPAALYLHGGGWISGTRRQGQILCGELAEQGWVVFAISYRLAPRFKLDDAVSDCKAAVAWIKGEGARFGASPDFIVALGGSAGGQLTALLALTANDPDLQPGFEQADTRIQGAVPLYGVMDFTTALVDRRNPGLSVLLEKLVVQHPYRENPEHFHRMEPISRVHADVPPMLLVHGRNDRMVPIRDSFQLKERLERAGARDIHLLEMPLAQHAFDIFPSPLQQRCLRVIVRFLDRVWRRHRLERQVSGAGSESSGDARGEVGVAAEAAVGGDAQRMALPSTESTSSTPATLV